MSKMNYFGAITVTSIPFYKNVKFWTIASVALVVGSGIAGAVIYRRRAT